MTLVQVRALAVGRSGPAAGGGSAAHVPRCVTSSVSSRRSSDRLLGLGAVAGSRGRADGLSLVSFPQSAGLRADEHAPVRAPRLPHGGHSRLLPGVDCLLRWDFRNCHLLRYL